MLVRIIPVHFMQPISRQQLHRNKYLRATSFEGKSDQGDSFRIPKGDRHRPQPQPQAQPKPMASVDDGTSAAGMISPESSFTTVILRPVTELEDSHVGMDENSSSCSSPPTHPAFYMPALPLAASEKTPGMAGKENVCPSSMAAPFSLSSSSLAVFAARKSPNVVGAGGVAASVMLDRFIRNCDGGEERRVLGDIDINVLAAPSDENISRDHDVVSSFPEYWRMIVHGSII